jgi:hypothetical protein
MMMMMMIMGPTLVKEKTQTTENPLLQVQLAVEQLENGIYILLGEVIQSKTVPLGTEGPVFGPVYDLRMDFHHMQPIDSGVEFRVPYSSATYKLVMADCGGALYEHNVYGRVDFKTSLTDEELERLQKP